MTNIVEPILAVAPVVTNGKTVQEVAAALGNTLCAAQLDPEWLCAANFSENRNEKAYGLLPSANWPDCDKGRIAVSVVRGLSDSWSVHVDLIHFAGGGDALEACVSKLLIAKVARRDHAWETARVLAEALNVV